MRVFKPTYREKGGDIRTVKKWWVETRDHLGVVRRFAGFTDQKQTETLGRQIDQLVGCKASGEPISLALSRWLEGVPVKMRQRFAEIGFLDAERANGGKPLNEHLADFKQSLSDKGDTLAQVDLVVARVRRVFEGCKIVVWTDISAERVRHYLSDLHKKVSKRTVNFYLSAAKHFCRWMVKQRRASESPIEHLDCVRVGVADIRHARRALEPDEMRRLLETTTVEPVRFGISGPERAIIYRLAAETGLRRNELRSLKVSSFDFGCCTVTVEAQNTKNRKEAVLPVRPDTMMQLRKYLAGRLPNAQVFTVPDKTAKMFRADLEAAGIAYVDESGRYADFHSLRHTTGTLLAAAGVHPKVAQSLMRHSDINLTMSRYTHTLTGQEAQAIASLPDFSLPSKQSQRAVATGTNRRNLAENLASTGRKQLITLDSIRQATPNGDNTTAILNEQQGATADSFRIRKPALYPTELRAQIHSCQRPQL